MLRTLIVDDEIASIESLEIFLNTISPEISIVGKAGNINEAEKIIKDKRPELVFLDIEMPHGSGFDLLDRLNKIEFHVIFITAFNQYAIKAFKYSAIDYILKPIDINSLEDAINRVKELKKNSSSENIPLLKENLYNERPQKIALASMETIEIVETKDIMQFEADGNYTTVHLNKRGKIIVSKSLGEYEEILKDDSFYRCHKSHLINLGQIDKVIKNQNIVILNDESQALISRRRKQEFLTKMQSFLENQPL